MGGGGGRGPGGDGPLPRGGRAVGGPDPGRGRRVWSPRLLGADQVWQPGQAGGADLAVEPPLPPGARVLLLRSDLADPATAEALRARGAQVDDIPAYRSVPRSAPAPELAARLRAGQVDAVTLASPSAAQGLVNSCGAEPATYARTAIVSIGP